MAIDSVMSQTSRLLALGASFVFCFFTCWKLRVLGRFCKFAGVTCLSPVYLLKQSIKLCISVTSNGNGGYLRFEKKTNKLVLNNSFAFAECVWISWTCSTFEQGFHIAAGTVDDKGLNGNWMAYI